jgi:Flp pilus assembly protein TadG
MRLYRPIITNRSGAAAVEFAFVAPLFILLTFGMIVFGSIIATYNAIEQLAAEAARASLGGTTDAERDQIARAFVSGSVAHYPFISPASLSVATASLQSPRSFKVTLTYDLSTMFAMSLGGIVPLPAPRLTRSSIVLVTVS